MATKKELLRAIRANCLDCCGGTSRKLVRECGIKGCPLWPYRTGETARTDGEVEGQLSIFDTLAGSGAA